MKMKFLPAVLISSLSLLLGMNFMFGEQEQYEIEKTPEEKARLIEEHFKFRHQQRADENGKFEFADMMTAINQANGIAKKGLRSSMQWENMGPNNVGGRTRGLVVDRNNPNLLYTGGVTGGLFYSTNGGQSWNNYFDQDNTMQIFTIGSMCQAVNGDIYVGTGNTSEGGGSGGESSGGLGNGIYKKAANSTKFELLASTFSPSGFSSSNPFAFVNKLSPDKTDPNVVYAATGSGVKITKDGGATWTAAGGALATGAVYTVKVSPDGNTLFAGKDGRIYKSTDKGNSWTNIATSFGIGNRVEISICDSFPDYVYALVTSGGNLKHVIRSTDNGVNWQQIGYSDPITQINFDPFCQNVGNDKVCQGMYDIAFEVHPKDKDKLYLGGAARFYTWSPNNGWLQAAKAGDFAGVDDYIHADMHDIVFDPRNPEIMYIMTDGGVFKTTSVLSSFPYPRFLPKNRNFNITQFYSMDVTRNGELLGGTQDNGTNFVSYKESSPKTAREVSGGDGFAAAISRVNPNYHFYTVYNGKYYRSVNRGESLSSIVSPRIDGFNGAQGDGNADNVPFYTAIYLLEHKNPNVLDSSTLRSTYIGTSNTLDANSRNMLYVCSNPLSSGKLLWFRNISISGYGYSFGSSYNGNVLYIGRAGGGISRLSGWNHATVKYTASGSEDSLLGIKIDEYTIPGANIIWGITVDHNDSNHIVAVTGAFSAGPKVFESKNGGVTWTAKQGNLPSIPTYAASIDPLDIKKVYVGGELGVWVTEDITAASPVWVEANAGMGRAPVFHLIQSDLFENGCPVLYAGTHGRGFFRCITNTPTTCKTDVTTQSSINNVIANKSIKLFPNPASDQVTVHFDATKYGDAVINVYNTNGQIVKREKVTIASGLNSFKVDVSGLNAGNYFVRIDNDQMGLGGAKLMVK